MDQDTTLLKRKEVVLSKLSAYGITDARITYLPYLDFSGEDFQSVEEVGHRILVLWVISSVAGDLSLKENAEDWLKEVGLWDSVSEREQLLFTGEPTTEQLQNFSWNIEAAIVLCWAVNLLDELPGLNSEVSYDTLDALEDLLPIGEDPGNFLTSLSYRDKEEVFIENVFNELITTNLRNLMFSDEENRPSLNAWVSYERHRALNWLRQFSGISEWDETDTST